MKKLRELLSQTLLPANLSERESNLKHFPRLQRVPRGELLFPRPTSAPHRIQGAEFHSPIPGVLSLSAFIRAHPRLKPFCALTLFTTVHTLSTAQGTKFGSMPCE
jgi:hypothetical protein